MVDLATSKADDRKSETTKDAAAVSTVKPPMTETISNANAATSTLFLGHNGEWWDFWLIIAVIAAALVATAIGVTTAGSIISHKREAKAAEEALSLYKLETGKKIS